jgi:DNA-binding CsgD family transcriptional regulator
MNDIDTARLEKACTRLGDTVLDPAMWPDVLGVISTAVGATGAVLLQNDVGTSDIRHSPHSAGVSELVSTYFGDGWHTRDLRAQRGFALLLKGENVVIDQDIVTPDEVKRLAYFNEFLAPVGLRWFAGTGVRAGPALWAISIQRTAKEGPFATADKHALNQLSQRLTEVATLSTAVGRIALSSAINALNAIREAALAIDRLGFVLEANAEAEGLFDDDIRIINRRLVVYDAEARSGLQNLMDRLRITPEAATLPCEPIVIRRRDKRPVILRVLPVHGAAKAPFLGARVILTLTPVEPRPGPNTATLVRAFGLTAAEVRVASIIARGISPDHAADELGVARTTVRNQLKSIFGKTDTHRQSELVALLSRL